jgi:predicted nuclease of predicted toxin-antitoxin system
VTHRFLANENFPAKAIQWLRKRGDDVVYAAEVLTGSTDEELLRKAAEEERIILTFDRDFGELVFHRRMKSIGGIVLIRLGQMTPKLMISMLQSFFSSEVTLNGFFTVVSPGHYRQTPIAE